MLKRRGLRQSPCSTPRPTVKKGVWNWDVIIEVLKSVYNNNNNGNFLLGFYDILYSTLINLT